MSAESTDAPAPAPANAEGSHGMEGSHNMEGSTRVEIVQPDGTTIEAHQMEGVPTGMAIAGIAAIIILSHFFAGRFRSGASSGRRLLQIGFLKTLVRKQWFPLLLQGGSIAVFVLITAAGLFGNQRVNIAPVVTWTWWWILLIFLVVVGGTSFCAICPWEGVSAIVSSFSLKSRIKKAGFEWRWPKSWNTVYPALILFVVVTWFELGHDVTRSPRLTALLALGMLSMAVITALFFERRAFCRHVCLVGRITGIYSLFSPIELRPVANDVCRTCTTKDCYRGNDTSTGCPTKLFPGHLQENTYCTLCTECVRACPHDNLAINLRPPAEDLLNKERFRGDEAVLAVVLLALTSFHGITMTPSWWRINDLLRVEFGLGKTAIFTILMALMLALPVLLFVATAAVARAIAGVQNGPSVHRLFNAFAFSVIPVALFYHLAHNCMHFFMEGQHIVPLLSDPFGWGWDLFGTAGVELGPLLSLRIVWWLQMVLIVVGHIYGVVVADRIARRLYDEPKAVRRVLVPLLVTMVLYSSFSVWLVAQPMDMRTGM
jgi:polyferredoxin